MSEILKTIIIALVSSTIPIMINFIIKNYKKRKKEREELRVLIKNKNKIRNNYQEKENTKSKNETKLSSKHDEESLETGDLQNLEQLKQYIEKILKSKNKGIENYKNRRNVLKAAFNLSKLMNEELIELVNEASIYLEQYNIYLRFLQDKIKEFEDASQLLLIHEYNQNKRIEKLENFIEIYKKTFLEIAKNIPIFKRLSSKWLDKYYEWKNK